MSEETSGPHPFQVPCQSCGMPVVWFNTPKGKRMPVNADSTRPTDAPHQLDLTRHRSHFSTCPHADVWRRKPRT